jgi:hypothetical protein
MPGDPKECREHAKCCLELAAAAASPMVRDNFLSLAQTWSRLARELEASKRFLDGLGEDTPVVKPFPPRGRVA